MKKVKSFVKQTFTELDPRDYIFESSVKENNSSTFKVIQKICNGIVVGHIEDTKSLVGRLVFEPEYLNAHLVTQ